VPEQIEQRGDVRVVAVADALDPLTLLNWEPEAGLPYTSHAWNDARLRTQVVYVIRDTLMELDPAKAAMACYCGDPESSLLYPCVSAGDSSGQRRRGGCRRAGCTPAP
jgi:hypothetical protein